MSQLGNVSYLFGKQFNVGVANTYSYIILSGNNLPENSLIISSPVNEKDEDTGTYSLLVTDYLGNPVRLTYSISVGNGLKNIDDSIYLSIDNYSIRNDNRGLYVDIEKIIDNSSIIIKDGRISIDTNNLNFASEDNVGVVSVDGKSIISDDGLLYVDTNNLDYSNTNTNTFGIVSSNSNKVNINNGVISVNVNNLKKCSNTEYGIGRGDGYTISSSDNGLEVEMDNLEHSSIDTFGLISTDGITIESNEGELNVNTQNLEKANEDRMGIIKIDGNSIIKDKDDRITINGYDKVNKDITEINSKLDEYLSSLTEIENDIINKIK